MKQHQVKQSKFSYMVIKQSVIFFPSFSLLFCMLSISAKSQYYYKDIWNNRQLVNEFNILKAEHFKTIKVKSFEDDGEASEGFFCEKKINNNYTQSQMISKSNMTGQSLLVSDYNAKGQPIKTTDDTPTTTSITEFTYDQQGKPKLITTITKGDDDSEEIKETHEYFYDDKGMPLKMLRRKSNVLISTIHFVTDSSGNVIEEDVEGNNAPDKKYFYYYDDKNRLTDVVHYNERAKRLLPTYMYEYNALNQPKQMISTEEGDSNYFIWRYTYNDRNLRETEKCFTKERKLLGTVKYEYQ
jgi:YD repeat-containing protein